MVKTSSAQLVIKPFQFIEEVTEGTVPGAGTTTSIGPNTMISVKKDGQWVEVPQLGSEDIVSLNQGPLKFDFQVKFNLINSTFLKYGVNAANYTTPTGTISASLTMLWSQWFNGTENYMVLKGTRPRSVTVDLEIGKPITATMDLIGMNIVDPSASAPAGITLQTAAPVGPVWDWISGGANSVSWGGTAMDVKKFSVAINRNTREDWTLGNLNPFSTQPHGRRIGWNFTNLWDSTGTLEGDWRAGASKTLAVVLKSATSTLTLTSNYLTNYNRDVDIGSDEAILEAVTGKSLSAAVT